MLKEINESRDFLLSKGFEQPEIGIVLGTGLHQLLRHMDIKATLPYGDIPHFPVSTVEFHKGNLVYGRIADKKVLIMQGRFHSYEGYSMQQIVFPIRVMKQLGIKTLFLSNAAGGMNPGFKKGHLVLINDHINLLPANPLTGKNIDELGPRFPDMSEPYNVPLKNLFSEKAKHLAINLKKGVYAAVQGPNLETKAEYRYLKMIGADMVGMSTVPEVIAAVHMNLPCIAVSVITDECDPDNLKPVILEEILEIAAKADIKLSELFVEVIKALS